MVTALQPSTLPLRHLRPIRLPGRLLWVVLACLLLGACGGRLGGYRNLAAPDMAGAPADDPTRDQPDMYLDLIRKMQQQGAYYASLAHIDAFRQRYGNPPELRRLQADALRQTGQAGAATTLYQALLDTSQAAAAWHGLGLIAATAGQHARAEQALAKAVQLKPINVDYLSDLGYARLRSGHVDAAREPLSMAAELAPDNVKAMSNLALWFLLSGHPDKAESLMQHAKLPQPAWQQVQKLAADWKVTPAVAEPTVTAARPTPARTAPVMARTATRTPQQVPAPTGVPVQVAPPAPAPADIAPAIAELPSPATPTATASIPASEHPPQQVPPPRITGIPGTMLDRFSTSTASREANP